MLWVGFAVFMVVALAGIIWAWRKSDSEQNRRD
jgi:hypothetical protein